MILRTIQRGAYAAFVLFIALFLTTDAFSQTRAAELAAKQAEKAKVFSAATTQCS